MRFTQTKTPTRLRRLASAVPVFAMIATTVSGQGLREDIGASERISLAAEIGTLSVQITAAACNINGGIAESTATDVINASSARFDVLDNALKNGDANLRVIGAETRTQNLIALSALRDEWAVFQGVADQVVTSDQDGSAVNALVKADGQIRQDAIVLFSEISSSYADSILLLQPDAIRLQLLANAQFAAARISRNVCALSAGVQNKRLEDELKSRFDQFDTALDGLIHGMDSLSIAPPPTQEIESRLAEIRTKWRPQRAVVLRLLSGNAIAAPSQETLFVDMNEISAELQTLTALYAASSKLSN